MAKKPKNFINHPDQAVSEMIQGLLFQYPHKLCKLDNHNVLLSPQSVLPEMKNRVHVLSGGGSGHEPSHAGWISKNMLSGVVVGGIFASPAVSSILAAIRAVTRVQYTKDQEIKPNNVKIDTCESNESGCLLIVKNYTGDRLNFGLASELAQAEGRRCRMVLVADDVAIPRNENDPSSSSTIVGARGVAGTVFVHKVAGAAASRNMTLDQVFMLAQEVASRVKTLGVTLDAVTIPGASEVNERLDQNNIEIGLGIHGEAGLYQSPPLPVDQLVKTMVDKIQRFGREVRISDTNRDGVILDRFDVIPTFSSGDELAVLVNNLGGASNFEMSIIVKALITYLEGTEMNCRVSRLYVGSFMTSFNMHGASLSIMSLTDIPAIIKELIDEETDAPAWIKVDVWRMDEQCRPSIKPVPEVAGPVMNSVDSKLIDNTREIVEFDGFSSMVAAAVRVSCEALISSEPQLTKYDTIVGDGDCGKTMERGAREILSRLDSGLINISQPAALFTSLADAISSSMGGTSGVLLELLFRKMSTSMIYDITTNDDLHSQLVQAFEKGIKAMSFYGGASAGCRTMLDALFPTLESLQCGGNLCMCAKAASDGANRTSSMSKAMAGRSHYLREDSLLGTPDPGAVAVSVVFTALAGLSSE